MDHRTTPQPGLPQALPTHQQYVEFFDGSGQFNTGVLELTPADGQPPSFYYVHDAEPANVQNYIEMGYVREVSGGPSGQPSQYRMRDGSFYAEVTHPATGEPHYIYHQKIDYTPERIAEVEQANQMSHYRATVIEPEPTEPPAPQLQQEPDHEMDDIGGF